MSTNKKIFEKIIYPGAQHSFHNDTNPDRYHQEAARQAWRQTLEWLRRWLQSKFAYREEQIVGP